MNEPKKINAGTSVAWSFCHTLADGSWQFSYAMRGPGAIDINATVENGEVIISELPSVTTNWTAGAYEWRLYATKGAEIEQIAAGKLVIEPDFMALGAGHDPRSHAKKMLESINGVLEGRILSDHERYSIDGRSVDRIPIIELHRLKRVYTHKVQREESGTSVRVVKRVLSRFSG